MQSNTKFKSHQMKPIGLQFTQKQMEMEGDVITFSTQTAQFVQYFRYPKGYKYGYSIYEFEVYGQVSDNDATLSSISINNSPISGFSPQTTSIHTF